MKTAPARGDIIHLVVGAGLRVRHFVPQDCQSDVNRSLRRRRSNSAALNKTIEVPKYQHQLVVTRRSAGCILLPVRCSSRTG